MLGKKMKVVLLALCAFALVFSVSGHKHSHDFHRHHTIGSGSKDIVRFVEGFIGGMEYEVGNASECVNDGYEFLSYFDTAIHYLEVGFKNKDSASLKYGLKDLAGAIEEIGVGLNQCGIEEAADDIKRIVEDLKSPLGIVEITVREVIDIVFNKKSLAHDFKAMIYDWKVGNYYESGLDLGEIVGILLDKE
eukprot:GCRY01000115.1.p1 GENE.GCRY01000115.1~~GCRY01000115.1.p1  ORF type:complete len:191 (-),score=45.17 GCRY01000115.1:55-627(-)